MKELFGVPVRFPDLSSWECQYTRWYAGRVISWQTAWGSCSVLSIDCINRLRVFAMTLIRIWAGILALTRRQIGETGWSELSLQIASYWNEALGKMFSQKRHPPDILFKTVWKKFKDVLMLQKKKNNFEIRKLRCRTRFKPIMQCLMILIFNFLHIFSLAYIKSTSCCKIILYLKILRSAISNLLKLFQK